MFERERECEISHSGPVCVVVSVGPMFSSWLYCRNAMSQSVSEMRLLAFQEADAVSWAAVLSRAAALRLSCNGGGDAQGEHALQQVCV